MKTILSNPPTGKFFGKGILEFSAAPVTQMLVSGDERPEDPSAAFMRTYSSASESSVSSSLNSFQMSRAFGREVSRESVNSTSEARDGIADSELYYMKQLTQDSSTSSDGGYGSPVPSSNMPKRDQASSGILFTVPEHATGEMVDHIIGDRSH